MATLDASIRALLKVISQIQNNGSLGGIDFMKTSKPYWHICTEKFYAAYIKAKNPEGFRDMFLNFYNKHEDKFTDNVVDDGEINDEWLKNKEVLKSDKNKKSKKSGDDVGFSLKNINCRGEVIYFDETNEKIRNVCIPITEAYLNACKIYSEGAKKGEYSPLPAQLLSALYSLMYHICEDEDDKKIIQTNIDDLKDVISQLTGEDEQEETTEGDTLNPLGSVIKNLTKKFNLGDGNGGLDMSSIEKTVGSLFNDDLIGKAKGIFNTFTEKVNIKEGADISTIISSVSDAMKDQSIQDEIKGALAEVATKVGLGPEIKFTEADKAEINGASEVVATEQE